MNSQSKVEYKNQWRSLYFPLGSHFLSIEDVKYIESTLKKFPLEDITIGDAGEINNCSVGRLVEDLPSQKPKRLNIELAAPILGLYESQDAQKFFREFLLEPSPQYIRRSQFNLLGNGSFVGKHLDIDSNPKYQIAAVLQVGEEFEGGEFVVYENGNDPTSEKQVIKPEYGSITISFCKYYHEVQAVNSGTRTSLVCFISNDNDINTRKSQ